MDEINDANVVIPNAASPDLNNVVNWGAKSPNQELGTSSQVVPSQLTNNSYFDIFNICEMLKKNKLYLAIGVIVLGIVIYYLYMKYFNKNKQSLLNFKNLYLGKNKKNDDYEDEEPLPPVKSKKKVVFNDNKKKSKKVVIESDDSSTEDKNQENEPEHIKNLDLTSSEIELINNKLK